MNTNTRDEKDLHEYLRMFHLNFEALEKYDEKVNAYRPYDSPENGAPTVCIGHKLKGKEIEEWKNRYFSETQCYVIYNKDVDYFINILENEKKTVPLKDNKSGKFGEEFKKLGFYQKGMLIDMIYNSGPENLLGTDDKFSGGYPNFIKGVFTQNCCLIKTQYHRQYSALCTEHEKSEEAKKKKISKFKVEKHFQSKIMTVTECQKKAKGKLSVCKKETLEEIQGLKAGTSAERTLVKQKIAEIKDKNCREAF